VPIPAGTFSYASNSWSNFTGSAASTPSLYVADLNQITSNGFTFNGSVPTLTLLSSSTSVNNTLGGTLSFTITWTPATPGETPPNNVIATFHRQATLAAQGAGMAELLNGSTPLIEMDSTNNYLTGITANLDSDVSVTLPLVANGDGTYHATGSITSDSLKSNFDTTGSTVTSTQEIYNLADLQGSM